MTRPLSPTNWGGGGQEAGYLGEGGENGNQNRYMLFGEPWVTGGHRGREWACSLLHKPHKAVVFASSYGGFLP